jgi:hypothetical protein
MSRTVREGERGAVPVKAVLGLLLVALGAIVLGDNLGWIDARDALRAFWPLAFVVVGTTILVQRPGRGAGRGWGLIWIVAGVWIFAHQRDWIDVRFWDVFWPGVLLLAGGSLLWRSLNAGRSRPAQPGDDGQPYVRAFALMAGNEVRSVAPDFRGADLGAFMGGVVLDLTSSRIDSQEAIVDVFVMWGGIEIKVPEDWRVTSQVMPLMGAYEDKTRPSSAAVTRRLVVRGVVVMGGVEIKN